MNGLFRLAAMLDHPANRAEFVSGADRNVGYFVHGDGDGRFLQFTVPRLLAGEGYRPSDVATADYIEATGSVPLFSERFVRTAGPSLADEVTMHRCIVECAGQSFAFFAGRTALVRPLIDEAASTFHTLTDGRRIVEQAVYRTDRPTDFFLTRDELDRSRLLASARFAELVISLQLNIRLLPPI